MNAQFDRGDRVITPLGHVAIVVRHLKNGMLDLIYEQHFKGGSRLTLNPKLLRLAADKGAP